MTRFDRRFVVWQWSFPLSWTTDIGSGRILATWSGRRSFWWTGRGSFEASWMAKAAIYVSKGRYGLCSATPELMAPLRRADMPGVACYKASPELFAGYQRGSVGNVEGQIPESTSQYEDPGIYTDGRFYLEGAWLCTRDTVLNKTEAGVPCRLILPYAALEVNAVLRSEGRSSIELIVQQDERFLTEQNRGEDIRMKPDGTSVLVVGEARLYNIVKNGTFGAHVLRIGARDEGLAVYSFTFVSDILPQSISKN
jgi:hypothetical protein